MVLLAGKYELGKELGAGAMGVVHAARNIITARDVAIKLLNNNSSEDANKRMLREASISGRLLHPNIVQVLDAGFSDEGTPFLVMELLRGSSLADRLEHERLTHAEIVSVASAVARALATAHAAGVVHRDLKPANIFIHLDPHLGPVIKVVDFGVGKIMHGDESSTMTGVAVGSPAYMSPEQARGDQRLVDQRSDLWSFGVLVFELVAGRRPFAGNTAFEVVSEILKGPIPHLRELVPDVDPDFETITERCIVRDLGRRASSAAELASMLERKPVFDDAAFDGNRTVAYAPSDGTRTVDGRLAPNAEPLSTGVIFASLAKSGENASSTLRLDGGSGGTTAPVAPPPMRPPKARPWLVPVVVASLAAVAGILVGVIAWQASIAATPSASAPAATSVALAAPPTLLPTGQSAGGPLVQPDTGEPSASAVSLPSASAPSSSSASAAPVKTSRPLVPTPADICARDPKRCR